MDLTVFVHFGMNTFTGCSTGSGQEDPDLFNPAKLDCEQWVIEAKRAGFHGIVLTAKHHEGFCLWPTKSTSFSVASSKWRDGKGDVVRETSDACRKHGLKFGVYCSPWDLHQNQHVTLSDYANLYKQQLRELLINYGPVYEMWFDGNHANIPDWNEIITLVRKLQPDAIIKEGPRVRPVSSDVRWVGNERSCALLKNWNVYPEPDIETDNERVWFPVETDTPLIGNWFWADTLPLDMPTMMNYYYTSVGRGSVFLMNIAPNREGIFEERTVARLHEYAAGIRQIHEPDYARMAGVTASASEVRCGNPRFGASRVIDGDPETYWAAHDAGASPSLNGEGAWIEIDLGEPRDFNVIRIEEPILLGQRIARYRLDVWDETHKQWVIANDRGFTIGRRKLDRIPRRISSKVRLTILGSRSTPLISSIGVHLDEISPISHFDPAFANAEVSPQDKRMPPQEPIPGKDRH
jgi:alpha-L-fucosidase